MESVTKQLLGSRVSTSVSKRKVTVDRNNSELDE